MFASAWTFEHSISDTCSSGGMNPLVAKKAHQRHVLVKTQMDVGGSKEW